MRCPWSRGKCICACSCSCSHPRTWGQATQATRLPPPLLAARPRAAEHPRSLVRSQAFQQAKQDLPAVRAQFDKVTFSTLIDALVDIVGSRMACQRAFKLWAEMRSLSIAPDEGIATSLMRAAQKLDRVEVALWLRLDLIAHGFPDTVLRRYERDIFKLLPSFSEIMRNETRWARLGVVPSLSSEQGALLARPAPSLLQRSQQRHAPQLPLPLALGDGEAAASQRERQRAPGAAPDVDDTCSIAPASASDEIFERHGWNSMDGSWRPL